MPLKISKTKSKCGAKSRESERKRIVERLRREEEEEEDRQGWRRKLD